MNQLPYCPICHELIMRPVWLPAKFVAWCHHCERGYTESEIIRKDETGREVFTRAMFAENFKP